jgi:hypothetical protein
MDMKPGRLHNRSLLTWMKAITAAAVLVVSVSSCSKLTELSLEWKKTLSEKLSQTSTPSAPATTPPAGQSTTLPNGFTPPSNVTITTNPDGTFVVATKQADGTITTQTYPAGTVIPGITHADLNAPAAGVTGTTATTPPTTGAPAVGTSTTAPAAPTTAKAPTVSTPVATGPKVSTPAVKTPPAPAKTVAKAPKPLAPEKLCYKMTYHHKAVPGHSDRESCSAHKNFIKLTQNDVNLKSMCLRVDNVPVKYSVVKTKKGKQVIGFMIEPVAGPNSIITANFCQGKMTCKEDCKIPKDSFMDAIGGDDNNAKAGENVQIVQWDPTEKGTDKDVSAQLEAELKKELAGTSGLKVFEDWVNDNQSLSCGTKSRASLPGVSSEMVTAARR